MMRGMGVLLAAVFASPLLLPLLPPLLPPLSPLPLDQGLLVFRQPFQGRALPVVMPPPPRPQ